MRSSLVQVEYEGLCSKRLPENKPLSVFSITKSVSKKARSVIVKHFKWCDFSVIILWWIWQWSTAVRCMFCVKRLCGTVCRHFVEFIRSHRWRGLPDLLDFFFSETQGKGWGYMVAFIIEQQQNRLNTKVKRNSVISEHPVNCYWP